MCYYILSRFIKLLCSWCSNTLSCPNLVTITPRDDNNVMTSAVVTSSVSSVSTPLNLRSKFGDHRSHGNDYANP